MTLLAIDVGNTRLKWAVFGKLSPPSPPLAQGAEFLENIGTLADGPWKELPSPSAAIGCVVAGDAIRRRVDEQLELWDVAPRWAVSTHEACGLVNGYDHPGRLGVDRWVAMIGARALLLGRRDARPMIVVMVGTAVTVDAVDGDGRFLGGLILPGHGMMLRALEAGTAGLHVPTGEVRLFPTNTSDALTSGGTFAIAGAVERMIRCLEERCAVAPACILTGGAGWKMAPSMTRPFELVDNLILDGLVELERHRGRTASDVLG